MASGPITWRQIDGETMERVRDFVFGLFKIMADGDCSHEIKRCLLLGRKSRDTANKIPSSQSYSFSSSEVRMWELDYKESWRIWCFGTVMLEKTLERPLGCKEIQPVYRKGNQFWIFIDSTDVEAESPIVWPPDVKSWLIWKDPDAGKDWGQEKGMTEDGKVEWHHRLNGHESEQTCMDCVFIYLGNVCGNEIARSYRNSMFNV